MGSFLPRLGRFSLSLTMFSWIQSMRSSADPQTSIQYADTEETTCIVPLSVNYFPHRYVYLIDRTAQINSHARLKQEMQLFLRFLLPYHEEPLHPTAGTSKARPSPP